VKKFIKIRRGRRGGRLDDGYNIILCIMEENVYRRFGVIIFVYRLSVRGIAQTDIIHTARNFVLKIKKTNPRPNGV